MSIALSKFQQWKQEKRPIIALTAWDWMIAQILDQAGVDIILVGDSLAMVTLGYSTTLPVTLEEMLHHAAAVKRGVKRALVVCDLPFLSYQESTSQAIQSAGRALKEAGVEAVKVEGGHAAIATRVAALTAIGIPVMGHVGLTPQSVHRLGYRQQGKNTVAADRILSEAIALAEAGAFAIVLEHIPAELAAKITDQLAVPTIGIGAGSDCDGQVMVTADLLGLSEKLPPFAKSYINLRQQITEAVQTFTDEVNQALFPPP